MKSNNDLSAVKDIIRALPKSRKIMRLYQSNNPMYSKTVEECFSKFHEYFKYNDILQLRFRQSDIFCNGETVYSSTDRYDNIAFLFFKDGIKEISIENHISINELEEFLKVISAEENEESEDDIALLMWEQDFKNIRCVVDETFMDDYDDYESEAMSELQRNTTPPGSIEKAFEDIIHDKQSIANSPVVSISKIDLQMIAKEIEIDSHEKTAKLLYILFGVLYLAESKTDCREIALFIKNALKHSLKHGNLQNIVDVQIRLKQLIDNNNLSEIIKNESRSIKSYISSKDIIGLIGTYYDKNKNVDKYVFHEFIKLLDEKAISPMISTLGELETIQGRKLFVEALVELGRKDISALESSLNDSKWYVVRNVLYILRKIADRTVTDTVRAAVKHEDSRVKTEAIKALGVIGGDNVLETLSECLTEPDIQVRNSSVRALGSIGTEKAKMIIVTEVQKKHFSKKQVDEKKAFFETLSNWKDPHMYDFLIRKVKKKSLLGGIKQNEDRACAAYGLGLLGNKNAVSTLKKLSNTKNKLLREYSNTALQRLLNDK